jgi:chromate transporter
MPGKNLKQAKKFSARVNQGITLSTLFWTFLKIGATAFGGFMALISVVQNYVVERRRLLTHEEMLNGISLATILPGPVAVNTVAYVGYRLRGGLGALVSAVAVILPSFFLITALSYAYFRWGQIPSVNKFFMGFIPAVSAIIAAAAWGMGRKTVKSIPEALIAFGGLGLLIWVGGFFITLAIIVAAGAIGALLFRSGDQAPPAGGADDSSQHRRAKPNSRRRRRRRGQDRMSMLLGISTPLAIAPMFSMEIGAALKLFLSFAGMSVLLFGGGFVFIPLMQESVVDGYGWVSQQEFIDSIAMGQVTPGPILISAAFIGYKVAGLIGATAATIGIFTPPALLMIACTRALDRIKNSRLIKAMLRGIRSGVTGMIAAAAIVVGLSAPHHWFSLVIFGLALFALLRLRLEVVWIIPSAGIAGLLFY